MGPAQRTFLQGLSELERNALLAHAETSAEGGGSIKGSRLSHGGRSELEQARQLLSKERERRQQLESQVASLQTTLRDQTALLDELRNDRDAMRQHQLRHDDRGTRLASQLASLEQENASLSAKLLAAHNERNQLQSKLDTMQVRVLELQQGYVSMASCDDGVDSRDLIRRSKIGGLLRDAGAAGVMDADFSAATAALERPAQNKLAGSTIAALTRERDALQQRLHELSGRLAESVSREAAARGAQALRSASWKRSAVQAEARLAAALKRIKELTEELRKRDGEARQRGKYTAQLERTVMAQHKSVQQLRRLLEMGGAGTGVPQSGSRDAAVAAAGPRIAATDDGAASAQASARGLSGTDFDQRNAGRGSGGAGAAVGTSLASRHGSPIHAAWPAGAGVVRFREPLDHGPSTAAGSPASKADALMLHQQHQGPLPLYPFQNPYLPQELNGQWGLVERTMRTAPGEAAAPEDWTAQPPAGPGSRVGPAARHSVDGAEPWVSKAAAAARLSAGAVMQTHSLEFEAPGSSCGGASGEDGLGSPLGAGRRSSSPPPAALHQQLNSMEASLAKLYRELEEFKDHSILPPRCEDDTDGTGPADVPSAGTSESPTLGHVPSRPVPLGASHDEDPESDPGPACRQGSDPGGSDDEEQKAEGEQEEEATGAGQEEEASGAGQEKWHGNGSFAFLPSQSTRPPWSPPGSPGSLERRACGRDLRYASRPHTAAAGPAGPSGRVAGSSTAPPSPRSSRWSVEGSLRDGMGGWLPAPQQQRHSVQAVRTGSGEGSQNSSAEESDDAVARWTGGARRPSSSRGHSDSGSAQPPRQATAAGPLSDVASAVQRRASAAPRSASTSTIPSSPPSVAGTDTGSHRAPSLSGSAKSEMRKQGQRPALQERQQQQWVQEAADGVREPSASALRLPSQPPSPSGRSVDGSWRGEEPSERPAVAGNASGSNGGTGSKPHCSCGGGGGGNQASGSAACDCGRCKDDEGGGYAALSRRGGSVKPASKQPTVIMRQGRMAVEQPPGPRRQVQVAPVAAASVPGSANCDDGADEQPRQPLPTHMLGHLLRCAAHHGHGHQPRTSPRGGGTAIGTGPSSRAGVRGYASGGALSNRPRSQRPAAAAAAAGHPGTSAAAAAHGIVVRRALADNPQAEPRPAVVPTADVEANPEASEGRGGATWGGQDGTPGAAAGRRGRAWPIGGRAGRSSSRSPRGGSASTTPRGSARGYATAGPASSRGAQRHGSSPAVAGKQGTAMEGGTASSYDRAPHGHPSDGRSVPGADPRGSRSTPGHSPGSSPSRPLGMTVPDTDGPRRDYREQPSSPEALSPISTLLANLSASPRRPPPGAPVQHQQPQRPPPKDWQQHPYQGYDSVSVGSIASQHGHGQQQRREGPAAGGTGALSAPESSTSSSHAGGLAGAKRRTHDSDAEGAEDRRKTRGSGGGSGGAASSGGGSGSGSNDSNTIGSSAGGRAGSSGCGSAAGPLLNRTQGGFGGGEWPAVQAAAAAGAARHAPSTYDVGEDYAIGPGHYSDVAADLGTSARWRPPDPRISGSQLANDVCADPGPPSPRMRIHPLPVPTALGRSSLTAPDSVGTSTGTSKGAYGRPTLAGWLGSSSEKDGDESTMASTAAVAAMNSGVGGGVEERPGDFIAGSPGRSALAGGGGGGEGRSSPVAAAAAAAATALQRLRDKRMQRMQRSNHQHLHRQLSGSSATSAAFREAAAGQGPGPPAGQDDGGLMVLALRGSLQGEVIVFPRLVPSASGSRNSSPGRVSGAGPEARSQAFFPRGGAFGAGADGNSNGEVTMRLEVGGGAANWRNAAATGAGAGLGSTGAASSGAQLPGAPQLGAHAAAAERSLRVLTEGMRTGAAAGLQPRGPVAAPAFTGLSQARQVPRAAAIGNRAMGVDRSRQGQGPDGGSKVQGNDRPGSVVKTQLSGAEVLRVAGADPGSVDKALNGGAMPPQPAVLAGTPHQPLQHSHPLMQLLGQASADLQLLSDRLKPLVGARALDAGGHTGP